MIPVEWLFQSSTEYRLIFCTYRVRILNLLFCALHQAVNCLDQRSAHFLGQRANSVVVGGLVGRSCKSESKWRAKLYGLL